MNKIQSRVDEGVLEFKPSKIRLDSWRRTILVYLCHIFVIQSTLWACKSLIDEKNMLMATLLYDLIFCSYSDLCCNPW